MYFCVLLITQIKRIIILNNETYNIILHDVVDVEAELAGEECAESKSLVLEAQVKTEREVWAGPLPTAAAYC